MDESRKPGMPTRGYVEVCREGYEDFGLDQAFLTRAVWEACYERVS